MPNLDAVAAVVSGSVRSVKLDKVHVILRHFESSTCRAAACLRQKFRAKVKYTPATFLHNPVHTPLASRGCCRHICSKDQRPKVLVVLMPIPFCIISPHLFLQPVWAGTRRNTRQQNNKQRGTLTRCPGTRGSRTWTCTTAIHNKQSLSQSARDRCHRFHS